MMALRVRGRQQHIATFDAQPGFRDHDLVHRVQLLEGNGRALVAVEEDTPHFQHGGTAAVLGCQDVVLDPQGAAPIG
jgi:hypothetical protein